MQYLRDYWFGIMITSGNKPSEVAANNWRVLSVLSVYLWLVGLTESLFFATLLHAGPISTLKF